MKNTVKKLMALLLAVIMLLALAACGQKDAKDDGKVELPVADGAVIGTGATAITVEVQGADGKSVTFTVNTDEKTVGAALLKLGGIAGEDSDYGLYVKTVNGETADWDKDQAWWCLTDATGEMTTVGVADIALHDGDSYAFIYTK